MNDPHIWWYVTRSSAIIAWILMTLAVVWGIVLSTRIFRKVDNPGWLQDLHRYFGGLSLVMIGVHIVSLMLDGWLHFTPMQALVPFQASYRTIPVAMGIGAFYLLVIVYGSSLFRNRLPPKFWKFLHYFNYGSVLLIAFHAGLTGTDAGSWWYLSVAVAILSLTATAIIVRLVMSKTPATAVARGARNDLRAAPVAAPSARVVGVPGPSEQSALLTQLGFAPTAAPTAATALLERPDPRRQPAIEAPGTAAGVSTLVVIGAAELASGVRGLRFAAPDRSDLPSWYPGAHLTIELPGGDTRQYSLCGDPAERRFYEVAVLREPRSRGGSQWIHEQLRPGMAVRVWEPRNHFPLVPAAEYLFVAGGIGITPLRAMIESLPAKREWKLIYLGRSRSTMAYLDELQEQHPGRVFVYARDEHPTRLDVVDLVSRIGGEVYCCGPESLIADVESATPANRFHAEHFEPVTLPPMIAQPLRLSLTRSGLDLAVPENRSILEVLEENMVPILASCRRGVCGTCELRVTGGTPHHRDSVLGDEEKTELGIMFPCVSRAVGDHLTLDV
ncbi:MAG: 2Fe-2S iron-sulfur cluster-binding protein [Actinomycetota bacterium]|nr:2Fe-2S iron-sulfur cluster-binding protein [Actinomycetota bacterium]